MDHGRSEDTRQRILAATYSCVARWGLAKTTIEDAARQAGLSRATVYRYYPGGRDELIRSVVAWEFMHFFVRLYEEVHDATSLEQLMEQGIRYAHRAIAEHEVLHRVMETEPETLLPTLTVESNRILGVIAEFLLPYLVRHGIAPGVDAGEAADFLARMVLSYMSAPGRWDLDDPIQVRHLVRDELLAGIVVGPEPGASGSLRGPSAGVPGARRPRGPKQRVDVADIP